MHREARHQEMTRCNRFLLCCPQAKDKGSPPMRSNTTLEVLVIDTNDNPPVFTQPEYTALVSENAFGGYQVCYQEQLH